MAHVASTHLRFLGLLPEAPLEADANSSAAFLASLFSFAASCCASFVTLSLAAHSKCFAWRSGNSGRGLVKSWGRVFQMRWALWRACMLMIKRSTGLCLMYDSIIPEFWRSWFWGHWPDAVHFACWQLCWALKMNNVFFWKTLDNVGSWYVKCLPLQELLVSQLHRSVSQEWACQTLNDKLPMYGICWL